MTARRRPRRKRLYTLLLRLLPQEFRGDFGEDMAADFRDRQADISRMRLWRSELPSLLVAAVREHIHVLWRDSQYALRLMRRTPGFTAMAVMMLGLGTGANVAVFTVIDAVAFHSPFPSPRELVIVGVPYRNGQFSALVPREQYEAIVASPGPLTAIGVVDGGNHLLTTASESRRVDFECVTPSMFRVLGTMPAMGRPLQDSDDRPEAPPVIVLHYTLWSRLGRPQDVIGKTITINQHPVTVVGVMPRGFDGAFSRGDVEGWVPWRSALAGGGLDGCRPGTGVNVFARVKADLSIEDAIAQLPGMRLISLLEQTIYEYRTPFLVLSVAVGCVLLIACLNVGGLQLERALARRRELALRRALGASSARLVRQALTENVVLAIAGAAAGVVATIVTLDGLIALLPSNLPHLADIAVNGRVLRAALVAAVVSGMIAGLIPALQGRSGSLTGDLVDTSRTSTSRQDWTRSSLIVIEIALSIVVLIGAGLMIRTFLILRPSAPGFEPDRKFMMLVRQPGASPEISLETFGRLFDRLREDAGIRAVAGSTYIPMRGTVSTAQVTLANATANAWGASITPDYHRLLRIPMLAGRTFLTADTAGSPPVAIVNDALARRLRPDGAVLGARVRAIPPRRGKVPPVEWTIVGIMADTRSYGSNLRTSPEFYVPYAQNPVPLLHVIVESDAHASAVTAAMQRAMRETSPDVALEPVESLREMVDSGVARQRLGAWLLGVFATIAVALAALGLMTTLGWWVRQRRRELSVRVALGASPRKLTWLVLRQGLVIGAAGIVLGCATAAAVTRYVESWIYGVTPLDRTTFVTAAVLMLIVAVVALYLPIRKVLRLDPIEALRAE
jgi:putative ABC transport system permease protein